MRKALPIILIAAISACAGSSSTEPVSSNTSIDPAYIGTFPLKTADFNSLPSILVSLGSYTAIATDGQIVVNQDLTYQLHVGFSLTQNGVTSTPQWNSSGTWAVVIVLGKPVVKFAETGGSDVLAKFTGDGTGVSGAAAPPSNILPGPPNGQTPVVVLSFSK